MAGGALAALDTINAAKILDFVYKLYYD